MPSPSRRYEMSVNPPRTLGLIGGLGPLATIYYYRELLAAHIALGQAARMLIAHADNNRVLSIVTAKDYDGLAHYLAELIRSTAAGGAELTAIVAVTPHICAPQLVRLSPLPLIDLVTEVAAHVRARGLKRVAMFGTRFTVESNMFGRLEGIEVVTPRPDEIEQIHAAYMAIVQEHGTAEHIARLRKLAHTMIKRDAVEAVLLAGTDLSTVFDEDNTDFPAIDCAAVHVEGIMRRLC